MYSVTWLDSNEKEQTVRNIPLIQLAVDVLEKLDGDERETAVVHDNNPEADLTEFAFELLLDRYVEQPMNTYERDLS